MQELESQLREDLSNIGLDVDFTLSLRPYSKTYFGRFDIKNNKVILYVCETPKGDMYPYVELLVTTVHELIHYLQWNDPNHQRLKGIMHDVEFKKLFSMYSNRARARVLFKEVKENDSSFKDIKTKGYDKCCIRS